MRAFALGLTCAGAVAAAVASCGSTTTCLIATCNGQCVDTTEDPNNCGHCGTHCDACTSSNCSLVVAKLPAPSSVLTTDGVDLYLAAPSTGPLGAGFDVLSIPASGGSVHTLASSDTGQIEGLASDGTSVYFTVLGTPGRTPGPDLVVQVPARGGATSTLASGDDLTMPVEGPGAIYAHGGALYFTNGHACASPCVAALVTMPVGGGAATTLQSAGAGFSEIDGAIAFSGSSLVFAARGASSGSTLYSAGSSGGGTPKAIQAIESTLDDAYALKSSLGASLSAIAVDGSQPYWGSRGSDVWRPGGASKPGAYAGVRFQTPQDSAGGKGPTVGSVAGVVVDATSVYWLYVPDQVQYQLWKAPKGGGDSVLLGQSFVTAKSYRATSTGLVGLGGNLYWSDGVSIWRTPK